MKNYTQFASNFMKYLEARNLNLPDLIGKPNLAFESNITHGLLKCHIFEVMDDVKRLLALTKTPKINDMVKLPFPVIFIDVNFKRKEMEALGIDIGFDEIQGIIVQEGRIYFKEKGINVGTSLRLSISALDYGEAHIFETYAENCNFYDEYKPLEGKVEYVSDEGLNIKARRFIKMFVMNFLNFINDPCVQYVTVEHDKQRNEQRINDGKLPIPNRNVIKLTGVLKKYVSELSQDKTTWNHSIRWWVRGHFRILRDIDYWGEKAYYYESGQYKCREDKDLKVMEWSEKREAFFKALKHSLEQSILKAHEFFNLNSEEIVKFIDSGGKLLLPESNEDEKIKRTKKRG